MAPDLIEDLRGAGPRERALFRAAMRGALVRHAAACRAEADAMPRGSAEEAELLSEAHAAMVRTLEWEG